MHRRAGSIIQWHGTLLSFASSPLTQPCDADCQIHSRHRIHISLVGITEPADEMPIFLPRYLDNASCAEDGQRGNDPMLAKEDGCNIHEQPTQVERVPHYTIDPIPDQRRSRSKVLSLCGSTFGAKGDNGQQDQGEADSQNDPASVDKRLHGRIMEF